MTPPVAGAPAVNPDNPLYRSRKRFNAIVLVVATAALAFGLFWLVWILGTLLYEGGTALARTALYYQMTPPPGADGGLANAIAGSLAMVTAGTVLGTPIGSLRAPISQSMAGAAGLRPRRGS